MKQTFHDTPAVHQSIAAVTSIPDKDDILATSMRRRSIAATSCVPVKQAFHDTPTVHQSITAVSSVRDKNAILDVSMSQWSIAAHYCVLVKQAFHSPHIDHQSIAAVSSVPDKVGILAASMSQRLPETTAGAVMGPFKTQMKGQGKCMGMAEMTSRERNGSSKAQRDISYATATWLNALGKIMKELKSQDSKGNARSWPVLIELWSIHQIPTCGSTNSSQNTVCMLAVDSCSL